MWLRKGINLINVVLIFAFLVSQICSGKHISRGSFPKGFVFGTASSAYQYEGAVKEDGKGPTIWDTFAHTVGKVIDSSNADVATDQYHLYPEDIKLMKDMGMDAYRFSIAWSRIYPREFNSLAEIESEHGKYCVTYEDGTGKINQAGIEHYNSLINALLSNGIEPYVTLYHWDLPQSLQDEYLGLLSTRIIKDFATYAETCFKEFGDRVKYWITFNEPRNLAVMAYDEGTFAPSRCSVFTNVKCSDGNSATEPYIVGHNQLLSHAAAVHTYKKKYQQKQRGSIGISLDSYWYEPATNSSDDIEAAQKARDFNLGWFLEPLILGDYPKSMRRRVKSRLPRFSKVQSNLLKDSFDFIGINHYTTSYASLDKTYLKSGLLNNSVSDSGAYTTQFKDGKPIGERANSMWLYIVPHGIRSLMNYVKHKYGNPLVIITENGMDDAFVSFNDALKDKKRIKYHKDYLKKLLAAIKEDGCNVKGYFVWSFLDNWEWSAGFSAKFGLYYVDYNDNLKRCAKDSAKWFKKFLAS